MEKENYCDSLSRSSEEEINYCSFNLLRSHLGSAKSKVPTERVSWANLKPKNFGE